MPSFFSILHAASNLISRVWAFGLVWMLLGGSVAHGREGEAGSPFLRNYTPREYGAFHQNWGVEFDKRGFLYVANSYGILEYDGARWRLIATGNKSIPFSMAATEDGRIYVGTTGDFGYLAPDAHGEMRYVSLKDKIPPDDRAFSGVYSIGIQGKTAFFLSGERFFSYDGIHLKVYRRPHPLIRVASSDNRVFVHEHTTGIWEVVGGELKLAIPEKALASEFLMSCFRLPQDAKGRERWMFTFDKGSLLIWDGLKTRNLKSDIAREAENVCGISTLLPGGRIAMGTFSHGIALLDLEGRRLGRVDKPEGLPSQTIAMVFKGLGDELWAITSLGLSRIALDLPLSRFDERRGLTGNLTGLFRHQKTLYASTQQGLFELEQKPGQSARFQKVPGVIDAVWAFCSWDEALLMASGGAILSLENGKVERPIARDASYCYCMLRSKRDPSRLYLGIEGGIVALRKEGRQWRDEGFAFAFPGTPRSLCETDNGDLWVGTQSMGVYHVGRKADGSFLKAHHYGLEEGLPFLQFNNVHAFKSGIRMSTKAGIYRLTADGKRVEPDRAFAKLFPETRWVYAPSEDVEGRIWMHTSVESTNLNESGAALPQADGSYRWDSEVCKPFSGSWIDVVMPESDGVVWFGGPEGLTRLEARSGKPQTLQAGTFIRKVSCGKDRTLFAGLWPGARPEIRVPYGENRLRFEFALPNFESASANQYQVLLEGQDGEWSAWSHEPYKEYTNLREGRYRLRVRGRDLYGTVGQEDSFTFTVLPPWYRTWWAFGIYALAVVWGIWALIQWRMRKLRQERDELEQKVQARTAELNQVNGIVKSINEKLEFDELLESILKEARVLPDCVNSFL